MTSPVNYFMGCFLPGYFLLKCIKWHCTQEYLQTQVFPGGYGKFSLSGTGRWYSFNFLYFYVSRFWIWLKKLYHTNTSADQTYSLSSAAFTVEGLVYDPDFGELRIPVMGASLPLAEDVAPGTVGSGNVWIDRMYLRKSDFNLSCARWMRRGIRQTCCWRKPIR